MLERDIPFLTWSYACDVLKDADGNAAGVVIVNRNGRQALRAKTIVDTTDRHHIARLAGTKFTEFKKDNHVFERALIADAPPKGEGVQVLSASDPRPVQTNWHNVSASPP